jgi:hypothetical protein
MFRQSLVGPARPDSDSHCWTEPRTLHSLPGVRIALALALLLIAFTGCGGGDTPADAAPPDEWVANVCGAVGEWVTALQEGALDVQTEAAGATSIDQARQVLVDYLDLAIDRTDEMVDRLDRAGSPAVEDGEAIADDIREEIGRIRPLLEDARDQAADLPDDPQTFAEQAQELGASLSSAGEGINGRLQDLSGKYDSRELDEAFDNEPACQDVQQQ